MGVGYRNISRIFIRHCSINTETPRNFEMIKLRYWSVLHPPRIKIPKYSIDVCVSPDRRKVIWKFLINWIKVSKCIKKLIIVVQMKWNEYKYIYVRSRNNSLIFEVFPEVLYWFRDRPTMSMSHSSPRNNYSKYFFKWSIFSFELRQKPAWKLTLHTKRLLPKKALQCSSWTTRPLVTFSIEKHLHCSYGAFLEIFNYIL